jgi:hypothetical protein
MNQKESKIMREVNDARDRVNSAQNELEAAEDDLQFLLKKYNVHLNEKEVTSLLPYDLYSKGFQLFDTGRLFILRDKLHNDIKTWNYDPSLTELLELSKTLVEEDGL